MLRGVSYDESLDVGLRVDAIHYCSISWGMLDDSTSAGLFVLMILFFAWICCSFALSDEKI
jgi:hypothetical protein